jgi:quercetin 2,3-dioxygenase
MAATLESETAAAGDWRTVARLITGQPTSDGAGVRLTRVIGTAALPDLDPFLMLDEFGSNEASDYIAGFPDHPHRGFETVTYMLAGRMRHRDNQGNSGLLLPGGAQWMTAGRGIVHSEMPEQEEGLMRGFQLWVNLPARDKMTAPRYQDIEPDRIPEVTLQDGTRVRVVAGTVGGRQGPVSAVATDPIYLDVALAPGGRFDHELPAGHAAFAYVYEGAVAIGAPPAGTAVARGRLAVLSPGRRVAVTAGAAARFILVAGRPLGEPVVKYGPFVMNTADEIRQAVRDYQSGRF